MQKIYDRIYKRDTKGNLRVWFMEQIGGAYRTIAGLDGGNLVTSEWTICEPTNVGRSNERDAVAQATFEIEAAYEKKLTREYHRTIEATDGGAHFFKPMLAQKFEEFVPGFAQPKLDGVRCIATKDGLFSREGKPIPGAPHVFEALQPLFAEDPEPDLRRRALQPRAEGRLQHDHQPGEEGQPRRGASSQGSRPGPISRLRSAVAPRHLR
jgi:DNA ligase-1